MNFTFERLSDSNVDHLRQLHHACYKKWLPVNYYKQKYNTKYLTPQMFGCLAFNKGKCIGAVGMIPYQMQYNGVKELAVQASDAMVHPAYRKLGLFTRVIEQSCLQLRNHSIAFLWVLPNQHSVKIITSKFGWKISEEPLTGYRIVIANRYSSYIKRKINTLFNSSNCLEKLLESHLTEDAVQSFMGSDIVTPCRNSQYFNYKKMLGSLCVKMDGISLWIKQDGALFIGDLDNLTVTELGKILPRLQQVAVACGAPAIYFQSHKGSVAEAAFASVYPGFQSWQVGYHNFNSKFPLDKIRLTMGDLDSF